MSTAEPKSRRTGAAAKPPPGATDRGHTLDDANAPRRGARHQSVPVTRVAGRAARIGTAHRKATAPGAAMVKVMPYRYSVKETVATLRYVLSKADRAEDDWAAEVEQSPTAIARGWGVRDDDGRVAAHMVFSLPNKDPRAEWDAARDAIGQCFPNSPYVCALHTDTENPHVHVVIRMRDYSGRKLRVQRDTLQHYRELLARAGRERGIAVEARRYRVPTRWRDRLRVFSKAEPVARRLDRYIAVLQRPAEATAWQIRRACKGIGRHHAEMHDGHRRGVLRAVTELEQFPTHERRARALCRLAFKGPHGDRFAVRQRLRHDIQSLGPLQQGGCGEQQERTAERIAKQVGDLSQSQRNELRETLGRLDAKAARRLDRALIRTTTEYEASRHAIDKALAALRRPDTARPAAREALRTLKLQRDHLQVGDRMQLRQLALPGVADQQAREKLERAARILARRPQRLRERLAGVARILQMTPAQAARALCARALRTDQQADAHRRIESHLARALDTVARLPDASRQQCRHAAKALARFHGQLSEPQRLALQQHAARLAGLQTDSRVARFSRLIARITRPRTRERTPSERQR